MPMASRRWCGSGDSPGSEICRRAMSVGGDRLRGRVDARARRAPVQIVAVVLPFAPARVSEFHVVLVIALRGTMMDLVPLEAIGTAQLPGRFEGRASATHVRGDDRGPKIAKRVRRRFEVRCNQ